MDPSMSISTHVQEPSSGSHSAYGKLVPIMNSVSQFIIILWLGSVPSSPIAPVTFGRSSGTASLPSSALAMPAPSTSATSITSSRAVRAP